MKIIRNILFLLPITILLTNVAVLPADTILYFPNLNGYVDPVTGRYTVIGGIPNDSIDGIPLNISTVTIEFQLLDKNLTTFEQEKVELSKLLPLGEINVPYNGEIPFKAELDDVKMSKSVKAFSYAGGEFGQRKYKPADLLLVSQEIHKTDSNELGDRWTISGKIRNSHTQPAENVYVVATLYNKYGGIIGVAGFDNEDTQPNTIGPSEAKEFFMSDNLSPDFAIPARVRLHAEGENSILRTGYYRPLLMSYDISVDRDSIGNIHVGTPIDFKINMISIARDDLEFYWILQIKKLETLHQFEPAITEHIEVVRSSAGSLKSTVLNSSWTPQEEGYYVYEVFVWSDLNMPRPLSHAIEHGQSMQADFEVLG